MKCRVAVLVLSVVSACGGSSGSDGGAGGGSAQGGGNAQGGGSASARFVDDGGVVGSGSRLRVRSLVADGGVRMFLSFLDQQRMESCVFRSVGATWACVPERTLFANAFSDPSCTLPATYDEQGGSACDAGVEALLSSAPTPSSTCTQEPAPRFFRGTRAAASVGTWYVRADGGCVAEQPDPLRSIVVGAGAEVPLSSFAQARIERVSRGALTAAFLVSDDGARQLQWVEQADSGIVARPVNMRDGGGWFLPDGESYVMADSPDFADPTCTSMPAAYSYFTCGEPGPWVTSFDQVGACGVTISVRPRGPRFAIDAGYTKQAGVCMPDMSNKKLYQVGPAAPLDTFPRARQSLVGQGAVRSSTVVDVAGMPAEISREFLIDGVPCNVQLASDGTQRCVTRHQASVAPFFSDSSCTNPLMTVSMVLCGSTPTPPFIVGVAGDRNGNVDFCAPVIARRVLRRFTGAMVYTLTGACTGMPAPSGEYFETELVPPAQLEKFSLVVE